MNLNTKPGATNRLRFQQVGCPRFSIASLILKLPLDLHELELPIFDPYMCGRGAKVKYAAILLNIMQVVVGILFVAMLGGGNCPLPHLPVLIEKDLYIPNLRVFSAQIFDTKMSPQTPSLPIRVRKNVAELSKKACCKKF
jgi:hypothetical protein